MEISHQVLTIRTSWLHTCDTESSRFSIVSQSHKLLSIIQYNTNYDSVKSRTRLPFMLDGEEFVGVTSTTMYSTVKTLNISFVYYTQHLRVCRDEQPVAFLLRYCIHFCNSFTTWCDSEKYRVQFISLFVRAWAAPDAIWSISSFSITTPSLYYSPFFPVTHSEDPRVGAQYSGRVPGQDLLKTEPPGTSCAYIILEYTIPLPNILELQDFLMHRSCNLWLLKNNLPPTSKTEKQHSCFREWHLTLAISHRCPYTR